MNNKVTYLIGAGASHNAHPLAKNEKGVSVYSKALHSFIKENRDIFQSSMRNHPERESINNQYVEIAQKCIDFGTPDTYAKWLYENKKLEDYTKLKKLISTYFNSYDFNPDNNEKFKFKSEYRILPFLTSIMNKGKIPDNIKIIS